MSLRIITRAIQRLSTVQTGKKIFFLLTKIYYFLCLIYKILVMFFFLGSRMPKYFKLMTRAESTTGIDIIYQIFRSTRIGTYFFFFYIYLCEIICYLNNVGSLPIVLDSFVYSEIIGILWLY